MTNTIINVFEVELRSRLLDSYGVPVEGAVVEVRADEGQIEGRIGFNDRQIDCLDNHQPIFLVLWQIA